MRRLAALGAALLFARAAAAAPFPSRWGDSGLLDVPDAEVAGRGTGFVACELRFDHVPGTPDGFGPLPLSIGTGLDRAEVGFSIREWSRPGDPRPAPPLMAAALKVRLLPPAASHPALALRLTLDRFNWKGTGGADAVVSTRAIGPVRFAGFAGGEWGGASSRGMGTRFGVAAQLEHRSGAEAVLQALAGREGAAVGGALRWHLTRSIGVSLGGDWLPGEKGFRVSLGFGVVSAPLQRERPVGEPPPVEDVKPADKGPLGPTFLDDRPHFRLRIPALAGPQARPAHRQYGVVASDEAARAALALSETRKEQAREAIRQHRTEIEGCAEAELKRAGPERAAIALKLTIDERGRVSRVALGEGQLRENETKACLRESAARWRFPASNAASTIVVPVTVGKGAGP